MLARIRDWQELPRAPYNGEHDKTQRFSNSVFFDKSAVKTGTRILHHARRDRPTTWVVDGIFTITGSGRDKVKSRIYEARTLVDRLEMRCEETGERRTIVLQYAMYSALWEVQE